MRTGMCERPDQCHLFDGAEEIRHNGGLKITFGSGIVTPKNPLFVATGDFHLKSKSGHFMPTGRVKDTVSSPALAKANPAGASNLDPACAGVRSELGAYGNSPEASCVP
jgi:hypothetical protein